MKRSWCLQFMDMSQKFLIVLVCPRCVRDRSEGLGVHITWMCPRSGHCVDAGNHTAVGLDQLTGGADKTEQISLVSDFPKNR